MRPHETRAAFAERTVSVKQFATKLVAHDERERHAAFEAAFPNALHTYLSPGTHTTRIFSCRPTDWPRAGAVPEPKFGRINSSRAGAPLEAAAECDAISGTRLFARPERTIGKTARGIRLGKRLLNDACERDKARGFASD